MENYILTANDREIILKYLYTKPYQEVAGAIAVLARLEMKPSSLVLQCQLIMKAIW